MGSAVGGGDNVAAPAGSSESNGNTAAGRRDGEARAASRIGCDECRTTSQIDRTDSGPARS